MASGWRLAIMERPLGPMKNTHSTIAKLFFCLSLLVVLPCGAGNAGASVPSYRLRLYHFLRDHRTGDVKDYDVKEFDLLHDLMSKLGHPDGEIDIVCGYRTPWSNNYLREHGHGVAEHSQHMEAKAID